LVIASAFFVAQGIINRRGYFDKLETDLGKNFNQYQAVKGGQRMDLPPPDRDTEFPPGPEIPSPPVEIDLGENVEDPSSCLIYCSTPNLSQVTARGTRTVQSLSLGGGVSFGSGIEVAELAEFLRSVDVQEELTVHNQGFFFEDVLINQDLTVKDKLDVAGNIKAGKNLFVWDEAHFFDNLLVDGSTNLIGILNADGGIEVDGDLFMVDGKTGDVQIAGDLTVTEQTLLNSNVTLGDAPGDVVTVNSRISSHLISTTKYL